MAEVKHQDVEIPYVKPNEKGELPDHAQMFSWIEEFLDMQPAIVNNARDSDREFSLSTNGFEWVKSTEAKELEIDWMDKEQVKQKYFPILEALVKKQTGASEVRAYHHVVRNTPYEDGMVYTRTHRCPARRPHVDVTPKFSPILFNWDCPDMYEDATKNGKHWQMINAWRPLKTVRRSPVAVVDTRTVDWEDYLTIPQPEVGPGVEGFWLQRPQKGAQHKWWYMDSQTPEEVLLFLQNDTKGAQVVPHTSFSLPGPAPQEPRESIEVRLVLVY